MLERSVTSLHTYILSCLYLLAGNADLSQCSPLSLNAQVIFPLFQLFHACFMRYIRVRICVYHLFI